MSTTIEATEQTTPATTWMKLARAAAITMVVWAILLHINARTVIPPVIVVGLIFLGFAPFLVGERRRLGLAYAAVALLALVGNAPVIIDELMHVDSAPSFVLTLLSVTAAITAIVAGLGAFFRWSPGVIRMVAIGGISVFALGSLVSVALFATTDSAVQAAGDTVVVAEKVMFNPLEITLESNETGILVENKDGIHHTFTIEQLGVDLDIPALKAARVEIDAAPGAYSVICSVPGHENMTATLTIEG